MGHRPPPPDPEFGANCLTCFPANKAPAQMLASFSGIKPCTDGIPPIYGEMPTSVLLTNQGGCLWEGTTEAGWFCSYTTGGGVSGLWLAADDGNAVFNGTSPANCIYGFTNQADCNFPATYIASGGAGQVTWRADVLDSIKTICEIAGFPNDLLTKFDVTPLDTQYSVFHFYREGWTKDVRIKIDMLNL